MFHSSVCAGAQLAFLLCFSIGPANVSAQSTATAATATQQQIQVLQEALAKQQAMLDAQAAELERMRQQLQQTQAQVDATTQQLVQSENLAQLSAQEAPRFSMINARPTIASADGRAAFSPRGVVQLDIAGHDQDSVNPATDFRRGSVGAAPNRETPAARDLSDGAYFRRARLGFEGAIARDFNYRLMLELGGSGTEGPTRINDAWISYSGFAPFTIQLGAFSPPANMDDGTNVESSLFIERASPAELSRTLGGADGRIGLGIRGNGTRWMSALTLTSRTVNDAEVFDSQLAVVGRLGFLAATGSDYNIHLGISGTHVFEPADQGVGTAARNPIRFRDRPEIRVDGTRLIDTASINADSAYVAGIELGANWKNWYLQAENFSYGIDRRDRTIPGDPTFGGFYIQGSWILTGERRRYDAANGAFQAPRPFVPFTANGGIGAWELALRYSNTDLDFRAGRPGTAAIPGSVRGGEQDIWSFGLSWYLNPNFRLLFNYLHIDVDRLNPAGPGSLTPFGAAPATPPVGIGIGQELDIYAVRSQFSF